MMSDTIKKVVGVFVPEEEMAEIDSLTGDDLRNKLKEFSDMRMEMFFGSASEPDRGKAVVQQAQSQINSLQSIMMDIGGKKQEFRPSAGDTPVMENIRQLVQQLREEGLSIAQIDQSYTVFGKKPLDEDIDPATLKVMAQRMAADLARYRQARMELAAQEGPDKDAPDNGLAPDGASPVPGMNMRPSPRV